MTYIINPAWFYWMSVLSSLRTTLETITYISITMFILLGIIAIFESNNEDFMEIWAIPTLKKLVVSFIISATIFTFIPPKETMIQMMVASQVTEENIEIGVDAITGTVDYIIEQIKGDK